jgi:hypothetical protein
MGPIQVVVEDGNNLVLEVTPTPDTTVILDRGIAGPVGPMGDGDVDGPASSTDNAVARFDGTTGKLIQNSVVTIADTTGNMAGVGTLGVGAITTSGALTYGGVTLNNAVTGTGNMVLSNSPTLVTPALGTPASGVVTNLTGTASININGTVGATTASTGAFTTLAASGAVTLSGGTANGVSYLNASKVLTTGSALTFDGTRFLVGKNSTDANNWGIQNYSMASAFASGIQMTYGGVGSAGLWVPTGSALAFGADGASGTTELMRLTSAGLGIGTSSPVQKLDVAGVVLSKAAGNAGRFDAQDTNSGGAIITVNSALSGAGEPALQTQTNHPILFAPNNTERMRLDSSGNLGLGVTPSAWASDRKTYQVGLGGAFTSGTAAGFLTLSSNTYYDGTNYRYIATDSSTVYVQTTGQHQWLTAPSGTAGNAISFTQAMTLDANGRLGIGTTSPAAPLHVSSTPGAGSASAINLGNAQVGAGSCSINYTSTGFNFAGVGGSEFLLLAADTGPLSLATFASNPIKFITNQTERARITFGGDLLVGTTSSFGRISVETPGTGQGVAVKQTAAGGYCFGSTAADNGGTYYHVFFEAGVGNQVGSITSNSTTTTYATSSDYRLKNTIAPMTGALAKVALLKPCTYKWNADGSDGEGFIAHELQAVVPQAVTGQKDAEDAEGKPQYQGIDTSFLVATLTAAIQELKAEFDAYKASHP